MRIFRLLLVCLLLHVKLYAQQTKSLTISVRNVPLETVLAQIKKQTGVSFFYKKEVLKNVGKITVEAKNATLKTVLDQCFEDTQIGYTVVGNIITLGLKSKKSNSDKSDQIDNEAQSQVNGMVLSTSGERLPGASIVIKRNHQGTIANANGEFKLTNVYANDSLVVSYIGYNSKQVPVNAVTPFSIVLQETSNNLDAVEVQAYGTTTKRLAIGEITQINAKDIARQPVTNALLALKSLVPGLLVTPTSGFSNAPVKMEIRGRNSIDPSSVSDPLYIIDGVPLIDANLKATGNAAGLQQAGSTYARGQSPFANINPNDIESITVLKDAAATAMYGSRAGNGVIIVKTKKGVAGKTKLDVSASQSVNQVIGHYDMLNTGQYLEMRREALRNDGLTPFIGTEPDIVAWGESRNVDWQKELWRAAYSSALMATLSGGSELTTFRISGSYNSGKDVSPLKDANTNETANVALNLSHRSMNGKLSLNLSSTYGHSKADQVGMVGNSLLAPNLPPIYDAGGALNYADWNAVNMGDAYPFASLLQPSTSSSDLLNSSLSVGYQVATGLNLSAIFGYNLGLNQNMLLTTIASQNPLNKPTGTTNFGNSRMDGWNITPQLDYSRYLGKGKLSVIIGANLNSTSASGLSTTATGYTSDKLARSINNAGTVRSIQDYAQSKYIDVHGSLNYIWDDKYILEFSASRDGSSNFGPGKQFGTFGVAGIGWIVSEEKWIKKSLPDWVSLIKLKASYGSTGTYPNIAYQYLSQWSVSGSSNSSSALNSYNGIVPQVPMHAVNQNYHWETVKQLNAAFDLAFLDDLFVLHGTYYRKRSDNQLTNLPTPIFTGFSTVFGNSAANVQNDGMELSLNSRLIDNKEFSWSATLNFSKNRNKLLGFPGIEYSPYFTTRKIGESLNTIHLYHYKGVDPLTGQRSYEDFDKNGVIGSYNEMAPGPNSGDKEVSIDLSPKFESSLTNQINYKSLNLVFQLSYRKMISMVPFTATGGTFNNNIPLSIYKDHWQKPGDISANPRFTARSMNSGSYFANSDGAYTDGSYLRLQNVALSYDLSPRLSRRIGCQSLRLMLSMQNVFTISKYPGIDPELSFGTQPQAKIFNGQLLFTF
jgi:TonB-linked SusC/RagA family outer membrane protein